MKEGPRGSILLYILTALLIASTLQWIVLVMSEEGSVDKPLDPYREVVLSQILHDVERELLLPSIINNTTSLPSILSALEEVVEEENMGRVLRGEGVTFRVLSINITLLPIYLNSSLPRWSLYGLENGGCSIYRTASAPLPIGVTIFGDYKIAVEGGRVSEGEILYDYYTPLVTVLDALWTLKRDADGGCFRDILQGMLNAIVRIRISAGVGERSGDSIEDLLSPLDVELALNFALMLEEISLFGRTSDGAEEALDSYFYNVSKIYNDEGDLNPTGFRVWSENEKEAYRNYMYRRLTVPDPRKRSAVNLLGSLKGGEVVDPVDLFLLYLFYDKYLEGEGITVNPYDGRGILSEGVFSNPRDPSSRMDPANPNLFLEVPCEATGEGLLEGLLAPRKFEGNSSSLFEVKRDPKYLVVGRDIKVYGLYSPRGWYTNAVLNTTSAGGGTRCGGVPPPPTPLDHDFRIWWNLKIVGTVTYTLTTPSGVILLKRDLNLSTEIGVFGWYSQRPTFPVQEVAFWNVNTGGVVQGQNYTMVVLITPVANATEYFLQYLWQLLRYPVSWGYLTATLGWEALMGRDLPLSSVSALALLWRGEQEFSQFPVENLYRQLKIFLQDYISMEKLQLQDLGYIEEDSFNISLNYDPYLDMFTLRAHPIHDESRIVRLDISGALTDRNRRVLLEVITESGKDSFKASSYLFGRNITSFRLSAEIDGLTFQMSFSDVIWIGSENVSSPTVGLHVADDLICSSDGTVSIFSSLNTTLPLSILMHYVDVNSALPVPFLPDLRYPPATISLPLKLLVWDNSDIITLPGNAGIKSEDVLVLVKIWPVGEGDITAEVYLSSSK
ncbi:MAG: hypothetical protein J7L88_03250 [Thermoplasmata archaeon]|nr:hypothetical protein [Thermoplasmata archaeon]